MNPKKKENGLLFAVFYWISPKERMAMPPYLIVPIINRCRIKILLTEQDFEKARDTSVLESLVVLKGAHYNIKMMLALTVCDLYSEYMVIPLNYRLVFETLMSAIDWPISFPKCWRRVKRNNDF